MATRKKAAAAPGWRVRIRMYRKWLGDCFLLSFRNGRKLSHILIDCGAVTGKSLVVDAVRQIHAETGGRLDALAVTHEHWDHVSGFSDAADVFKTFAVGEVWAAWTEDPDQTIAKESKKISGNRLRALESAMLRFGQSDDPGDARRGAALAGLAAFSQGTNDAMKTALELGPPKFFDPGDVVERAWLPGVKVYVLGPPKDLGALHNMMGRKTDLYGGRDALALAGVESSFAAAASAAPGVPDRYAPFDRYLQWDAAAWSKSPGWPGLAASYAAEPDRRIDNDWLNSAAELALQMDSYTNNTSLALAFELTDTGEVLLFPGDAQIGNWLSWAGVKFPAAGGKAVTGPDLLARTVFYKVGHHGSHNATLKPGGLEAMRSPKLVAAIPVDEQFARASKHWDMPAGPLLAALAERTKGRVLRADQDFPAGAGKPEALPEADWRAFSGAVAVDKSYVEYTIP